MYDVVSPAGSPRAAIDALALVLLALDARQLELYSAMAARWVARWVTEQRAVLGETALIVGALYSLTGTDAKSGAFALLEVAKRRAAARRGSRDRALVAAGQGRQPR
jgi:hypothetical protein